MFVAMDEVSFDVMDELAPGCVVQFPHSSRVSSCSGSGDDGLRVTNDK